MANKRLIQRQRRRMRVELEGKALFTVDVAPGGLCVESMRPLPPRTHVAGKVRVRDRDLEFSGVVCWAKGSDVHLQMRGRMGIRFTSIAPEYFEELQAMTTARTEAG